MLKNKLTPVDLIKPIPSGGSWTDAPRSQTWLNPPKLVKVDEVAQRYVDMLSSEKMMNSMLDVVETKVPLASMAEALMLSGVASGAHTIDVGILVTPVIIEMLKTVADMHGVEYSIFPDDGEESEVPERVLTAALKRAMVPNKASEEMMTEPVVELSGLMTRKPVKENVNGI